ncbi:MAG: hypothetical protein RDV41_08805 [Planctomycetota bacterium]|nr:hypothetical protein [Planctomycetota bacterium]
MTRTFAFILFFGLAHLVVAQTTLDDAAPSPAEIEALERQARLENMKTAFDATTLTTVILGGLIDGVNPCAFSALVFLINYLVFIGRKRREIVVVGAGFTAGVFITYFVLMFGIFEAVRFGKVGLVGGTIVSGLAALLAVFLTAFSLWDTIVYYRTGRTSQMVLRLSPFLTEKIHTTVRKSMDVNAVLPAAVVMGCLIALFESACTGQVMLPVVTIIAESGKGDSLLALWALFYLLIYNLMFILPLVAVFAVVALGVKGGQLADFVRSKLGTVKVLLSILFLWLSIVLVWQFVQRLADL